MRIAFDMIMIEQKRAEAFAVICTLLSNLVNAQLLHEYLLITARPQDYRELSGNANVHIWPVKLRARQGILIQHQLTLAPVLQRMKPDLLCVPHGVAVIGWHGPLLLLIHDRSFLYEEGQNMCGYAQFCWPIFLRESMRRARVILTTHELTYAELFASWQVTKTQAHLITPANAVETLRHLFELAVGRHEPGPAQ